jgi:nucleotide-binding universal stress UspA family protein
VFRTIVVPLDGSKLSEQALPYAAALAKQFNAQILLLQVVPPIQLTSMEMASMQTPTAAEVLLEQSRRRERASVARSNRYLQTQVKSMQGQKVKASSQVVLGAPAVSIMEAAQKAKADLIVMSTRGRGGLKRALLGSVADTVVRESTIPVLLIRPSRSQQ